MSASDLNFLSIESLAALLRRRKLSPVELTRSLLDRVACLNPKLNAFLTVTADRALADARRAEKEILAGRWRGPLHGVPISLKDNIWTRGIRTTAGSRILADFVPDRDATVARRLRRAGAVLLGKTNMHEFAYGVTNANPHYGPARNPWDLARIPGGSSGGSAAALAAGLCFASIGSDTGGSIRIPAALCGIVGLKPTFGRVSCFGVIPLAHSLDHTGPLARTVADAAIVLRAIAGRDPLDPTTSARPVPDYPQALRRKPARVRLGWPREYFWEMLDPEVRRIAESAAHSFADLGATIEEVSLPHLRASEDSSTHIALAEARQFHESSGWYPARAADYGEDVRKRLELASDVRAVDYLAAFAFRKLLSADFDAAFSRVDALLAPSTPIPAPLLDEKLVSIGAQEESVRSALLRLNRPANFTGPPAMSIPCGFTSSGLPVGLQLIGRSFDEQALLRLALLFEQSNPVHSRHPSSL